MCYISLRGPQIQYSVKNSLAKSLFSDKTFRWMMRTSGAYWKQSNERELKNLIEKKLTGMLAFEKRKKKEKRKK
jgi:hypothetical protein